MKREFLKGAALAALTASSFALLICDTSFADATYAGKGSEEQHAITISELLFRIEESADIGAVKDGVKVELLEKLRDSGFNAVGAENLVFGQDKSQEARFVLGGTVKELECVGLAAHSCRILISWEVLDRKYGAVVYKVDTRAVKKGITSGNEVAGFKALIQGALVSMTKREKFVELLTVKEEEAPGSEKKNYEKAGYKKCGPGDLKMPKASKEVLGATVLVESDDGFGSGVIISPDGFILTAAHVVNSKTVKIIFHDAREAEAKLIRFDQARDVALLKMAGNNFECLNLRETEPEMGEKLYAIGSPASKDLAFSLSGGIVSGLRKWDEYQFLQTDASINSGNSGGPMVDEAGNVMAIVSWKLHGIGVEGVAFGIPTSAALDILAIDPRAETAESLQRASSEELLTQKSDVEAFVDTPDPYQSADIDADIASYQRENASWIYTATLYGGAGLLGGGAAIVVMTYIFHKSDESMYAYEDYESRKNLNTAGWIIAGVGAAAFATSFFFRPSEEEAREALEQKSAKSYELRLDFAGNYAGVDVRF